MADIVTIKDYLKKLQRIIDNNAEFHFGKYHLVKRTKIDDVMCCILASLPDTYKKVVKSKMGGRRYESVLCFGLMTKFVNKKFFLDNSMNLVNANEVGRLITSICKTIERDIRAIDEVFNN